MKARLAIKLAVLAIVALGSLAGCIIVQNSALIVFDNSSSANTLDCYFDGELVGTVDPAWWISFTYRWSGSATIFVDWAAYNYYGGAYYNSGIIQVIDGQTSTIVF